MPADRSSLLVVFAAIYVLNTLPAFAPPTWMILSVVGFDYPQINPLSLTLAAAIAATLGRITLAASSQLIIRNKLFNIRTKENIGFLKDALEHLKNQTMGELLIYPFTKVDWRTLQIEKKFRWLK